MKRNGKKWSFGEKLISTGHGCEHTSNSLKKERAALHNKAYVSEKSQVNVMPNQVDCNSMQSISMITDDALEKAFIQTIIEDDEHAMEALVIWGNYVGKSMLDVVVPVKSSIGAVEYYSPIIAAFAYESQKCLDYLMVYLNGIDDEVEFGKIMDAYTFAANYLMSRLENPIEGSVRSKMIDKFYYAYFHTVCSKSPEGLVINGVQFVNNAGPRLKQIVMKVQGTFQAEKTKVALGEHVPEVNSDHLSQISKDGNGNKSSSSQSVRRL